MNNNDNCEENVFFSLDETSLDYNNEDIINNLLDDFDYTNQINNLTSEEIIESFYNDSSEWDVEIEMEYSELDDEMVPKIDRNGFIKLNKYEGEIN